MRIKLFIFSSILTVFILGCSQQKPIVDEPIDCDVQFSRHVVGRSVQGREIELFTFGNDNRETILYIASIHGSERAGTALMGEFISYLQNNGSSVCSDKRIVIAPNVNPDGFFEKTRHNINGIDLNRNFPAENRQNNEVFGFFAYSEPESRTIANIIDVYQPKLILVFHEPLNCIDYDGHAEKYAHYLADHCDLEAKKLGARPGSLGAYAGETLGIPIITVEFGTDVDGLSGEIMWVRYSGLVLAACESINYFSAPAN